jgi:hypothetical protein
MFKLNFNICASVRDNVHEQLPLVLIDNNKQVVEHIQLVVVVHIEQQEQSELQLVD